MEHVSEKAMEWVRYFQTCPVCGESKRADLRTCTHPTCEEILAERDAQDECPRCNGDGYLTLWGTPRPDVACGECGGEGRS